MKTLMQSLQANGWGKLLFILAAVLLFSLGSMPARATDLEISSLFHRNNSGSEQEKYGLGKEVWFQIFAKNTSDAGGGPYDSNDTEITVTLPEGVTFLNVGHEAYNLTLNEMVFYPMDTKSYTLKGNQLTIKIGDMSANTSEDIIIQCTAVKNGTWVLQTAISGSLNDPVTNNNKKECSFTIDGKPGTLQFAAATYTVNENGGTATITVTRTGGSDGGASVSYATSDGTAVTTEDYTEASGTLTWTHGDITQKSFTVPIIDDTALEENETVNLTLKNTAGPALGTQKTAVLTILDSSDGIAPDPGGVLFESSGYSVKENAGNAVITVMRSCYDDEEGYDGTISVDYTTKVGTATVADDYKEQSGTLTWGDKDYQVRDIKVQIVDDTEAEEDETVRLILSNPTGGAILGTPSTAVLTIVDDDDEDSDGIPGQEEDSAPNNGDGNDNQLLDSEEENVSSFTLFDSNYYCTLASPIGTVLKKVAARDNPSWDDRPLEAIFSCGFIDFSVDGLAAGSCTEVTLLLTRDETINSYYKYGPTPDNPQDHWYEFLYDGHTGAEIFHETGHTRIVLHLCDGERGDHDLVSNGIIVDPGGPATISGITGAPQVGGSGSSCFIGTIAR